MLFVSFPPPFLGTGFGPSGVGVFNVVATLASRFLRRAKIIEGNRLGLLLFLGRLRPWSSPFELVVLVGPRLLRVPKIIFKESRIGRLSLFVVSPIAILPGGTATACGRIWTFARIHFAPEFGQTNLLIVLGSLRLVGKKLVGLLYLLELFLSFASLRLILDLVWMALENQLSMSRLDLSESRILLNS
jgi:hypothetical protein